MPDNPNSVHRAHRFSHRLNHLLVRKGIQPDVAAAVSAKLSHAAKYAYDHPLETVDNAHTLKEVPEAWRVIGQAQHLGSNPMMALPETRVAIAAKIASKRASIAAGGVIVTKFLLEQLGIPVNKCALSFSTVTIDAAEVVGGGLAAETVAGGIFAAISAHAASEDSMEFVANCFDVPKEKQEKTRDDAASMRTVMYTP